MPGPRLIEAYHEGLVAASRSAMLELALALGKYREAIVLVGGWVPCLLVERYGQGDLQHVGSIDIDLAVDPDKLDPADYATIVDLIERRGYSIRRARDGQPIPFSFEKPVPSPFDGQSHGISVDFLAPCPIEGRARRHRRVQSGLPARVAKGCSLAFRHNIVVELSGTLPGDGEARCPIRMLDITGCIAMKGIVLGERYMEKDAYDVFSVIGQCLDGPTSVAAEVRPHLDDLDVASGIEGIRSKFRDLRAEGPSWVATFMSHGDMTERERVVAEAFVTVRRFLDALY